MYDDLTYLRVFGVAEPRGRLVLLPGGEHPDEGDGGVVDEVGRGLVSEDGAHAPPDLPRRPLGVLARLPEHLQRSAPFVNSEIEVIV